MSRLRILLPCLLLIPTLVPVVAVAEAPLPASAATETPARMLPPGSRPVAPSLQTAQSPALPPAHAPAHAPIHPPAHPAALPWFDEVRDQRRMLADQRRARREVEQDARKGEFLRRRQERRELIDQDRRLFLNYGPWLEPMAPATRADFPPEPPRADGSIDTPDHPPAGWDNGWYYNGW